MANTAGQWHAPIDWYDHTGQAKNNGATALYSAAQNGNLDIVEQLWDAGADVNVARKNGCSPLYIAAKNGHIRVIEALLEASGTLYL